MFAPSYEIFFFFSLSLPLLTTQPANKDGSGGDEEQLNTLEGN